VTYERSLSFRREAKDRPQAFYLNAGVTAYGFPPTRERR
jgi:hypothetical protein